MQKNKSFCNNVRFNWLQIMRISAFAIITILTTANLLVASPGHGQLNTEKYSLNYKNTDLLTVLKGIEKKADVVIMYELRPLFEKQKIDLVVKEKTISEILDELIRGRNLVWSINENIIRLREKNTVEPTGITDSLNHQLSSPSLTTPPITGIVRGPDGQPIGGANVVVKGTKSGTITNANGEFELKNVNDDQVVIISSIGFEAQELKIGGRNSNIRVSLKITNSKLDEVQVIAYGNTTQRLNTGNVSGIKAKDIETQPINNPLLTLTGRIPGLTVTQNSGISGTGVTIRIQGVNSLTRGNDPFYVVDGVPYTQQLLPTLGANILQQSGDLYVNKVAGSGNPLSYINSNDIESIDVLKDAEATAIYGSRAANGAILITTKRGKSGRTRADITIQSGAGKIPKHISMLNTQQYLEMRKEAYKNDGLDVPTSANMPDFGNFDLTVYDQDKYKDWQKELIGNASTYNDAQASISGGTNNTTFRLNVGFHKETTVFPGNFKDTKGSFGVNITHASANQKFKLQFSGNYLADNNQLPTYDLTRDAVILPPNSPSVFDIDGNLNWQRVEYFGDSISTWTNPLGVLQQSYQNKTNNLISNLNLLYSVIKGLDAKISVGYTNTNTTELSKIPLTSIPPEERFDFRREGRYSNGLISSWIVEPQLSYRRNILGGKIDFLLGSTFQSTENNLQQYNASVFSSDAVIGNILAATNVTAGNALMNISKYNALFTRASYNWKEKYLINVTARRDGSSRFGAENQLHNFGAIGVAWIFSNENFANISRISFGKLRASYGTTGNDQFGDYAYLDLYNTLSAVVPYQGVVAIRPRGHANPYLQWEQTNKFQAALDLGFLQDRILFNLNYFNNQSSNQLVSYGLPSMTGFTLVDKNLPAKVQNTGWEISINTLNIKRRTLSWTTTFNLTTTNNKLVNFPNIESSTYANLYVVGKSVKVSKFYRSAGVNSSNGVYEYLDSKGETTVSPNGIKDRTVVVDVTLPRFYGGINNSLTFKRFQLDLLMQFVKQQGRSLDYGTAILVGLSGYNQPISVLDRWTNPGDVAKLQKFSNQLFTFNQGASDAAITNASFLRLKNASISWSMPFAWTQKIHFENIRLFIHGQNLLTFTKYKGFDPETQSIGSLPPLRVFTFGIQAGL
jgi:TonB-dependent starch-binding outer membrane protein SusC